MEHAEIARRLFCRGYSCAQAVLAAFGDVTGLDEETALALASGFGAGTGRLRLTCGACTGAFMVAGLVFGGYSPEDNNKKKECYALVQQIARDFEKQHSTLVCAELLQGLKADTSPSPQERNAEYYKVRPCVRFVETAARILDERLNKYL
ncbi:MAG: C-GCAxxG-C-C family protein [Clostridia bacterium]|nr:C-GCAxxG-C-C family protein [Clostridia bacterium]